MKDFRISSWANRADEPEVSQVVVAVLETIGDIVKKEEYEFSVAGQYDHITDEFTESVRVILTTNGLI